MSIGSVGSHSMLGTYDPPLFYLHEQLTHVHTGKGLSALILGGTGAAGSLVLQEILASPHFARVSEYGRRITAAEKIVVGKEKLEQKVMNYEDLESSGLRDGKWDVIFIALGTSSITAKNRDEFTRVDKEYVVNAAREAKSSDPEHRQRLLYISAIYANPSSYLFYFRSKGLTERALAQLGYDDFIAIRPASFGGVHREVKRPAEEFLSTFFRGLTFLTGSVNLHIHLSRLAMGIRMVGEMGSSELPSGLATSVVSPEGTYTALINGSILALTDSNEAR
ncbi:uncharacterized protein FIBRA_07466 [Fibroporia radiculosa]|uniref:NAD(P)-binding domain-containing protein n=1 Tax=Fibroporia radiculosa TaxID=599839 RepID=J4IBU2_9APHY|nr:uncharacterized protein FIBRA_07466 [Fibroporia radiculosa]CCM05256.1 predicted protein [Fibroporia radiculosa]